MENLKKLMHQVILVGTAADVEAHRRKPVGPQRGRNASFSTEQLDKDETSAPPAIAHRPAEGGQHVGPHGPWGRYQRRRRFRPRPAAAAAWLGRAPTSPARAAGT